jgi:transcriptional regulator GlxA family with amidase domain
MKKVMRWIVVVMLTLCWTGIICSQAFADQEAKKAEYICPPCGCDADNKTFNEAGTCPSCRMALVEKNGTASATLVRKNVAILVFDGVELLDFAGTGEVFKMAGSRNAFNVYTVAPSAEPILSQGFVTVKAEYSIADAPAPEILVVPGGNTVKALNDERVISWIKQTGGKAEITLSVCGGAFLLAKAGLLDGLEATTHWSLIESLRQVATKTTVRENVRFVDNGKMITTAGVSAGIDGALHVVDRLLGRESAKSTARYMEYKWQPEEPAKLQNK